MLELGGGGVLHCSVSLQPSIPNSCREFGGEEGVHCQCHFDLDSNLEFWGRGGGTLPNVTLTLIPTFELFCSPSKEARCQWGSVEEVCFLIGRSRGGGGGGCCWHAPPMGSNSFIFAHFFAKKHQHRRLAPPNGKSWICHCKGLEVVMLGSPSVVVCSENY